MVVTLNFQIKRKNINQGQEMCYYGLHTLLTHIGGLPVNLKLSILQQVGLISNDVPSKLHETQEKGLCKTESNLS